VPRSYWVETLGCPKNQVDSDKLTGTLVTDGMVAADSVDRADVVVVNTCAFVEEAREESIATILALDEERGDGSQLVVTGCMAQRYGDELAAALPEVAGVLGFADYPRLPSIVSTVLAGGTVADAPSAAAAAPARRSLPLLISAGSAAPVAPDAPPTAAFPVRTVPHGPWAYLKIAGGCDRVCTFCTIPSFRGRYASRPLDELLAEARWLVEQGVRELVCVSENTTSWGKDLPGGRRAQVDLIRGFESVEGLERVRLLYLQPAEIIPELLDAMADSPVVAGYYDLSLQHASASVLARMARSGSPERFALLVADIRRRDPGAVFRSSFITGFPGETESDVEALEGFLRAARLDWTGFFTFSVEDGVPSATMPDQVPAAEAAARRDHLVEVAEAIGEEATEAFVGRELAVLVEEHEGGDAIGRSYRESPETDGEVRLLGCDIPVGRMVPVRVVGASGVDLVAEPITATNDRPADQVVGSMR
jgi:ribosomal protein S12 methylthiotransferase